MVEEFRRLRGTSCVPIDPDGDSPVRAFDPQVWVAPDGKLHWSWTERRAAVRDGEWNRWADVRSSEGERLRGVVLDAENMPAKPCPFPHPNSRFFVRRLASGTLLLVKNGSMAPNPVARDYTGRVDMTAYVSDDDGMTWKGGLLLHKGQCAYPDGDQTSDGTIHVTFDGDRYQKQEIFHVSFTEADVRRADSARGLPHSSHSRTR